MNEKKKTNHVAAAREAFEVADYDAARAAIMAGRDELLELELITRDKTNHEQAARDALERGDVATARSELAAMRQELDAIARDVERCMKAKATT
jgi:hypothetical protein